MPVNTLSVGAAVTPTVIHTYLSHYLNRRSLAQKPTAHISYHQGLELIRRFLHYASLHTVDELQAFTSQWVPVPQWVHAEEVEIPISQLQRSAKCINTQLGPAGIEAVGGKTWWQWRRDGSTLKAEWIEMRKDFNARRQLNIEKGNRIMLYVHGGAYFFGSVDEHRYQLQRHARKLKARVIAPRYRLAPQFPFPCGLHDCMATYLYLLAQGYDPSTLLLAGDSAGGGMVLSMLVILRDQGIPLPAGAILISPWVDLTHSFPSLDGDGKMDYIPSHGFLHKPSMSWPPPTANDLLELECAREEAKQRKTEPPRVPSSNAKGTGLDSDKIAQTDCLRTSSLGSEAQSNGDKLAKSLVTGHGTDVWLSQDGKYSIGPSSALSVQLEDDKLVAITDQIQLYAPNHLLTHPLVSPALQPTLGGLPPLLVQVGGGELLRDEQIYVAHKAAEPSNYLPPPSNNQTWETIESQAIKFKPTNVQLQVWEDMCHVGPTLSFSRPAKHMFRSIAQFGAWCLAHAQKKPIDLLDEDNISDISSSSSTSFDVDLESTPSIGNTKLPKTEANDNISKQQDSVIVGKAGDPLPPFECHMIRQRIDRHGNIHPLAAKEEFQALNVPTAEIGVPKPGPVRKWMKAHQQWNSKFAKQKIKIQKQRKQEIVKGFDQMDGETPPPTALAGRRVRGMEAEGTKKKSLGMAIWSGWGSKHDKIKIDREEKADHVTDSEKSLGAGTKSSPSNTDSVATKTKSREQSRSFASSVAKETDFLQSQPHHSTVNGGEVATTSTQDLSNAASLDPSLTESTLFASECKTSSVPPSVDKIGFGGSSIPQTVASDNPQSPDTYIPATDTFTTRPTKGGIAYPFRLKVDAEGRRAINASTVTLESMDIKTPFVTETPQIEREHGIEFDQPLERDERVKEQERPDVKRVSTADSSAAVLGSGRERDDVRDPEKIQRPGVERFVTAQEDLSVLAA